MLTNNIFSQVPEEWQLLRNDLLSILSSLCLQVLLRSCTKVLSTAILLKHSLEIQGQKKHPASKSVSDQLIYSRQLTWTRYAMWTIGLATFKQNQLHLTKKLVSLNRKGTAYKQRKTANSNPTVMTETPLHAIPQV